MSKTPTAIESSSSKKARAAAKRPDLLRWLDYLPLAPLTVAAVVLALSPPLAEPHLWQKLKLFAAGEALQAIDILDFALHASLPVVLLLKFLRARARSGGA